MQHSSRGRPGSVLRIDCVSIRKIFIEGFRAFFLLCRLGTILLMLDSIISSVLSMDMKGKMHKKTFLF